MTVKKSIGMESIQYTELVGKIDALATSINEIKTKLAAREYIDDKVIKLDEAFVGNGKPGWPAVRDKVLAWENKGNAIIVLIGGDIIFRILQETVFK